jgi:hypothetical protein
VIVFELEGWGPNQQQQLLAIKRKTVTKYYRLILGIPRHRQEDNIKMDLGEIGWGCMDFIHLA